MIGNTESSGSQVRLDKWLWAARFYKTRGLAADAIDGGKVHVNGERIKRAKVVRVGDQIRVRNGPYEHIVIVKAMTDRRGSASVAAELYEETADSRVARERIVEHMKAMHAETRHGPGRPTKRDRRQIEDFRQQG